MNILMIEDNRALRQLLEDYLMSQNYKVHAVETGEEGIAWHKKEAVDLVLLDIMLPGMDGIEVCRAIRKTSMVPIIMMTAKSEDHDKILGLDVGADDYIVKPFSHEEMAARIRAITRRLELSKTPSTFLVGLEFDRESKKVRLHGQEKHLTKKETDLLEHFIEHPNQLFSRDHLLDALWGYDYYGDARTVDSHIKRLREKLTSNLVVNWQIKTVWGQGYLFEVNS